MPVSPRSSYSSINRAAYCESYLRIKKRKGLTWSTRYVILFGGQLQLYQSKQDASNRRNLIEKIEITGGRLLDRVDLGLLFHKEGNEGDFTARTFAKGDLVKWITAFYQLSMRSKSSIHSVKYTRCRQRKSRASTESMEHLLMRTGGGPADDAIDDDEDDDDDDMDLCKPMGMLDVHLKAEKSVPRVRRVSFDTDVIVRIIPTLPYTKEQVDELFYSKDEMAKFYAKSNSIFCRTNQTISHVVQSLRQRIQQH